METKRDLLWAAIRETVDSADQGRFNALNELAIRVYQEHGNFNGADLLRALADAKEAKE